MTALSSRRGSLDVSRPIRVAIDRRVQHSAPEVAYVFRTLLTTGGYPWHLEWADAAQGPVDIAYGEAARERAIVFIPQVNWEFARAPACDPVESGVLHGVPFLQFNGAAPAGAGARDGVLEFSTDVIFSSYWWLTGAREPTYPRDRWDNLSLDGSVIRRDGLLMRPPVSLLADCLRRHFQAMGLAATRPGWVGQHGGAFAFTHDVDYPEIIRWIEAPRALLQGRPALARDLTTGRSHFWQFQEWIAFERELGARPTFYFMVRRGSLPRYALGTPDAFYDVETPRFAALFNELRARGCEIGLHASYHAHRSAAELAKEREKLERVAGTAVLGNRHHYWHLDPRSPNETLRRHEAAGLSYDSSLAFEFYPGFRRGICHPFQPFHPGERRVLDIVQLPPAWMDDHFDRRRTVNGIEDPDATAQALVDVVRHTGGVALVDYHARGMNADVFPRYGPWLRRFAGRELAGNVSFRTGAEITREFQDHARTLECVSRDELEENVPIEVAASAFVVEPLAATDIEGVAALHHRLFGDPDRNGHSVATLGSRFLARSFYPLNLDNPHFHCDVAKVDGRVVGFSVYTTSKDDIFRYLLRRRLVQLAWSGLQLVVRDPRRIRALLGNARYFAGERPAFLEGVPGWWLVAGVAPEFRTPEFEGKAKGKIAALMFDRMEQEMRATGCSAWYGVVHPDNAPINIFLKRRGAEPVGTANAQGKPMLYYVKRFVDALQ